MTFQGRRIFIREGESIEDAMKRQVENKINERSERGFNPPTPEKPKRLTVKQIQETIVLLPRLNRAILEQNENQINLEDIGLTYDEDMYQKKCKFILENIPYDEQISSQAAYLIRAFTCSQMFKEGNRRTTIIFTEMWLQQNKYHLKVSNKELWNFIKRLLERCPRIPISNQEIISKDQLYQDIEKWIDKRIAYII